MKSTKQLSLIGLTIILILSSCSIEKRIHKPGYHIDWKNDNRISNMQELEKDNTTNKTEKNKIGVVDLSENETNKVDKSTTEINNNITVSADNERIVLTEKEKNNLFSSQRIKTADEEIKTNPSIKPELKNGIKSTPNNTEDKPKMSGMALTGFICSVVGLTLMIIVGWPFLLGTLGTVFSAIGLFQTSKGQRGKGFAIAGLIIGIVLILVFWLTLNIGGPW